MPEGEGQEHVGGEQDPSVGEGQPQLDADGNPISGEHEEGEGQPQARVRMVPLNEHVGLRKKYQSSRQENEQLKQELAILRDRETRSQKGEREESDPLAKDRKQWKEFLGLSRLEQNIEEIRNLIQSKPGVDPELEARLERAEVAASVATDNYFTDLEKQARDAYNPKEIPISKLAWEKVVAAEMSPQETVAIMRGDRRTYAAVIARAKAIFKPAAPKTNPFQTQREAERLRTAPRVPGPGGTPPPAPAAERVTGRKLHDRAQSVFAAAFERER